jgi:diguanylate cyclase (GGDEF)-like protein
MQQLPPETALVVDDDPISLRMVVAGISSAGLFTVQAGNGREAIALFERYQPRVVLLDRMMPEIDGIEVCKTIRSSPWSDSTYVIMLTSRDDMQSALEAFDAGVDDYVAKPFHPSELLARVRVGIRQVRLQRALREQVAIASRLTSELMSANSQLKRIASVDELTGLLNRRGTTERLNQAYSLSRRHGTSLSLAMIDLDDFKHVNDTEGHATGDDVLRGVARVIASVLRESDVAGRLGGDEFVIALPHTDLGQAEICMTRLLAAMSLAPVLTRPGGHRVTACIGLAQLGDQHDTLDQLVADADKAVYDAKHAGRNRLAFARVA